MPSFGVTRGLGEGARSARDPPSIIVTYGQPTRLRWFGLDGHSFVSADWYERSPRGGTDFLSGTGMTTLFTPTRHAQEALP